MALFPFKLQVQVKRGKEREARRNSPLSWGGIKTPDSQSFQWNKIHRVVNDHKSVSLKLETWGEPFFSVYQHIRIPHTCACTHAHTDRFISGLSSIRDGENMGSVPGGKENACCIGDHSPPTPTMLSNCLTIC